jgi:3-hydroxyacyl-CoA dehydrogenase/enoyl-CoA hydratase/3-hydroxybutyryl-CoA epimerase
MTGFTYNKDADNIVTITMDMPDQPVNTMNTQYDIYMQETLDRLDSEIDEVAGIIFTSAKKTFFAGGDLKALVAVEEKDSAGFFELVEQRNSQIRRYETMGKPVVAAINGAAMGGGLEIALACHHRIAIDSPKVLLGLPEVTLGLLPGCGGIVRLGRLIGLEKSLPILTQGKPMKASKAKALGIVDELASDQEEMIAMAKAWIRANPESAQAFDQKGFKIPGGTAAAPHNGGLLFMAPAIAFKKLKGLLPAPTRIIALAAESTLVDVDTALRIASRGLTELVISPEAKNLITTFFFGMNALKSGESRPKGPESKKVTKLGILGAGMMGQGIAYVAAKAGIEVVLKDVTVEAAGKGRAYSEKLMDKAISRAQADESAKEKLLGRISATASAADLQGCDLIVEAVFEDMELKATVTREAEPQLKEGGVFASNTSTLPITELSRYSANPAKFIGIHFFSPVDRMPLVEIITGKETTDETLALAFDFVQQIGKVPIVVNDSRGFFTSRVFGTYLDEGCRLLTEGVDPQLIEAWSSLAGMPVGPLAVHDEISLALTQTVGITNGRLDVERGENFCSTSLVSTAVAGRMVDEFGRKGRAFGSGFYDYGDDRSKKLWPELSATFAADGEVEISRADLQDRVIFRQVLESLHCLQEGVFRNLRDGNIGSIMGIGFPTHTGGVFQYINTYGIEKFINRCNELETRYGERFKAPAILIEQARSGEWFQ